MGKRTGPSNIQLRKLIVNLKRLSKKEGSPLWKRVAEDLNKATRQRTEVNIEKINRFATANETVVVAGKVLSAGKLEKKVSVAAWRFSKVAKEKINKIGKAMTIEELMESNPSGKGVRILG